MYPSYTVRFSVAGAYVSDLGGVWVWMIGTGLGVGVVGLGLSEHFPRTHVELAGVRSY